MIAIEKVKKRKIINERKSEDNKITRKIRRKIISLYVNG